jgi:hypothetical protein
VFPPSYVDFVTRHGTFSISGAITGRRAGNDAALFSPADVVKQTERHREELATTTQQILNDGILFCGDPCAEYFHLFVISGADANGEMKTRGYDYQDPANTDPWFEGDGTFLSVVEAIAKNVRERALDDE